MAQTFHFEVSFALLPELRSWRSRRGGFGRNPRRSVRRGYHFCLGQLSVLTVYVEAPLRTSAFSSIVYQYPLQTMEGKEESDELGSEESWPSEPQVCSRQVRSIHASGCRRWRCDDLAKIGRPLKLGLENSSAVVDLDTAELFRSLPKAVKPTPWVDC